MPTHLQHLLSKKDLGPLFVTVEGRKFVSGAIHQLRHGAACAGGLANVLSLLDKKTVPAHIVRDIIKQAYELMEAVGACEVIFLMTEPVSDETKEDHDRNVGVFSMVYTNACKIEEGLRRLCRSTVEIYCPEQKHVYH